MALKKWKKNHLNPSRLGVLAPITHLQVADGSQQEDELGRAHATLNHGATTRRGEISWFLQIFLVE